MAREEQQPMSDARLAEREARFDAWLREMPDDPALLMVEVGRLREENLWLRAREAALVARNEQAMAIVGLVATQDSAQDIDDPEWMQCLACGGGGPTGETIEHHEICYYVKARALLGGDSGGQS